MLVRMFRQENRALLPLTISSLESYSHFLNSLTSLPMTREISSFTLSTGNLLSISSTMVFKREKILLLVD